MHFIYRRASKSMSGVCFKGISLKKSLTKYKFTIQVVIAPWGLSYMLNFYQIYKQNILDVHPKSLMDDYVTNKNIWMCIQIFDG